MYIKIPKDKISRIAIVKTDCKLSLSQVVAQQKCDYAINGGLYNTKTGQPNAIPLRINGKTIATSSDGYWVLAWNNGPDICMDHSSNMGKYKNAIACSTMLKSGQNTIFSYTSAQGGVRGRTGFGDDKDNVHLVVTTDNNGPMSPTALRTSMKNQGAENAIMLDCGGSSQMYYNGKYLQAEKRKVSYWVCVWVEKSETDSDCSYPEPTRTLKKGSVGEDVKWLQFKLNLAIDAKLPLTDSFWTITETAVKNFQKKYSLSVDGIAGPATISKLKEVT